MNSLDLPQILYQPFAATGDKNTILNSPSSDDPQRANLQTGFPPITQIPIANGGIPPERMDFNGLGYLLSSFYFFTQCGGVYTFNQDVSNAIGGYPLGAVLHYTNSDNVSFNVRSLLENNTYNFVENPEYIDNEHWEYVSSTPITQDTSASSTSNVFSTAAVQSLLNTVVHKTGNETIGGIKTLYSQDSINLRLKSNYIDDDYTPSTPQYSNFLDNIDINNKLLSRIYTTKKPNGANGIVLQAWKGNTNYVLAVFTDGTTIAPPSDAIDSIVTTTGINKAENGYVKLGNGLIIQWGTSAKGASKLVNLPTAFTSTNYKVVVNNKTDNGGGYYSSAINHTTTTFTINSSGGATSFDNDWIAIGY